MPFKCSGRSLTNAEKTVVIKKLQIEIAKKKKSNALDIQIIKLERQHQTEK